MKKILPFILVFLCGISYSQTAISGKVVDDSGQPLPGANVLIKDTTTGTQTDFDGDFSIEVASGDILVVSYLDLKKKHFNFLI